MIYLHVYECHKDPKSFSNNRLMYNLSHYLAKSKDDIKIWRNKNGKPMTEGIFFSVSHCRNQVVQIFSKEAEVGTDIEYMNPKRRYVELALRYYHTNESHQINTIPSKQSMQLFYNLWTAKESVCKTHGGRLWYYLSDNYLSVNNSIKTVMKGIYLQHIQTIPDFSLCIASTKKYEQIIHV